MGKPRYFILIAMHTSRAMAHHRSGRTVASKAKVKATPMNLTTKSKSNLPWSSLAYQSLEIGDARSSADSVTIRPCRSWFSSGSYCQNLMQLVGTQLRHHYEMLDRWFCVSPPFQGSGLWCRTYIAAVTCSLLVHAFLRNEQSKKLRQSPKLQK